MKNKYIVLVGDEETDEWTVAMNSGDKKEAYREFRALKSDGTPAIIIATSDFVTV
jgi:DNA polymerase III delta subunit